MNFSSAVTPDCVVGGGIGIMRASFELRCGVCLRLYLRILVNSMKKVMMFLSVMALSAVANAYSDKQLAEIEARIVPVGQACLEGDNSCGAASGASGGEPRSGEKVYAAACVACHGTGAAGAPKLGDAAAWSPRIAKGVSTLYTNAIKGINGMPPMGACGNCSDEEMEAAVDYIVKKSK